MDKHSKKQISKNMRAVRSKNTGIEVRLRKTLKLKGVRYRLNNSDIYFRETRYFNKEIQNCYIFAMVNFGMARIGKRKIRN